MFGFFRLALAFNVVAYHIAGIPTIGKYAVYSFFILSGFLMTTIMKKTYGYTLVGFKRYFLNRFLRLYPIYWVLLIISFFLFLIIGFDFASSYHHKITLPQTTLDVIANIFFIYPEYRPVEYAVRLAPATWALTIELFFYFLIGLGISKTKSNTCLWFGFSILYVLYKIVFLNIFITGYGTILSASLPFSIGAMLYYYQKEIYNLLKKIRYYIPIFLLLFVINLIIPVYSGIYVPDSHWKVELIGAYLNLALSSFLITILLFDGDKYFNKKVDRFLGDLSYPVYIFHITGAVTASWLIFGTVEKGLNANGFITFIIASVITIAVSIIVNHVLNKRIESKRNLVKAGR